MTLEEALDQWFATKAEMHRVKVQLDMAAEDLQKAAKVEFGPSAEFMTATEISTILRRKANKTK
jgi:hypothetical protein